MSDQSGESLVEVGREDPFRFGRADAMEHVSEFELIGLADAAAAVVVDFGDDQQVGGIDMRVTRAFAPYEVNGDTHYMRLACRTKRQFGVTRVDTDTIYFLLDETRDDLVDTHDSGRVTLRRQDGMVALFTDHTTREMPDRNDPEQLRVAKDIIAQIIDQSPQMRSSRSARRIFLGRRAVVGAAALGVVVAGLSWLDGLWTTQSEKVDRFDQHGYVLDASPTLELGEIALQPGSGALRDDDPLTVELEDSTDINREELRESEVPEATSGGEGFGGFMWFGEGLDEPLDLTQIRAIDVSNGGSVRYGYYSVCESYEIDLQGRDQTQIALHYAVNGDGLQSLAFTDQGEVVACSTEIGSARILILLAMD